MKSQPHNTPSKSNLSLKLLSHTLHFKLHCEIVLKENIGKKKNFFGELYKHAIKDQKKENIINFLKSLKQVMSPPN